MITTAEKLHKNWKKVKDIQKSEESSRIKGILKEGDKFVPIKCYTGNFSRRKIGVLFASKELSKFLIKYLPFDFLHDCGVDKDGFIYFNFVNPIRNVKRRIYKK